MVFRVDLRFFEFGFWRLSFCSFSLRLVHGGWFFEVMFLRLVSAGSFFGGCFFQIGFLRRVFEDGFLRLLFGGWFD